MAEPNFKGLLQIHCQKAKVALPHYNCTHIIKNNRAFFTANLTVLGQSFTSEAVFSSKKQAEKSAAKIALIKLGILSADKLNSSYDPAQVIGKSGSDESVEQKEGQAFAEVSPSLPVMAEQSNKDVPFMSVCLSREQETAQGLLLSCSREVERSILSSLAQNPVSTKDDRPSSYKNVLQEKAQKMGLPLPQYETTKDGDGFVCTVTFNGQCFKSDKFSPNKKMAQQNAAFIAIEVLTTSEKQKHEKSVTLENKAVLTMQSHSHTSTPDMLDAKVSYKNLLQENCQQRGHRCPVYSTTWQGSGFVSVVHVGSKTASSKTPCETKKKAEQLAAREALLMIGVFNPEDAYNKGGIKDKLNRKFAPVPGCQRTSWVHSHGGQGVPQSSQWRQVDYFWEQAILRKRQKLDPSESHANTGRNLEARTFELPQDHRQDFTVGEIWKEKKNIVIVGDADTSFILYCTRIPGTRNIFNTRTMSLVLLEPGCRIVGLDGQYCDHSGKVALQAERCADVIIPETPDPVLTSCGVVLLFQGPQSGSLQVLLKRYLSSQAFVNVAAALAQYFRRRVSGRHVQLDIQSVTEHICDWMSEEVQSIATMNKEALQQVFSYMWKFNKRWCTVLDHPLPKDLEVLKARAADELERRQASDIYHSEDHYHPWGLPKGNFKHRMLSTGLFIERAADCAVRELKEETGIKLDADYIKNCAQIDLPQTDNLNPHKGDMVKYFLYVYCPDSVEDDLNASHELEQMNKSLEFETFEEQLRVSEFPHLNLSPAGQETKDNVQHECNARDKTDISFNFDWETMQEKTVIKMEGNTANESMQTNQEIDIEKQLSSQNDNVSQEKRGIKRKWTDNDDNSEEHLDSSRLQDTKEERHLAGQSLTQDKCEVSLDSVSTPESKQGIITARSPQVHGSVHEECAWFTIDEARVKSPVFQQIYQTQQFTELLNSLLNQKDR